MAKAETLARVERDIAQGDLGKARDRLEGLFRTYPADMDVRERLGAVYWALQYPGAAGRFWYLHTRDTEERKVACAAFKAECGGSVGQMFHRLRGAELKHCDLPPFARERLHEMESQLPSPVSVEQAPSLPNGLIAFLWLLFYLMIVFACIGLVATLRYWVA